MAETFVNLVLIMLPAAALSGVCGIYSFFAEYLPEKKQQKIADRSTSPADKKRNSANHSLQHNKRNVKEEF